MILSPKARHLTDGRPLSRLGKVHASMTLLSLLHRFACMASEIIDIIYVRWLMEDGRGERREDGLLSCNAIGHIGKLGEVGLVKGMIHAYDCIGSKAFALHEGKTTA